MREIGKYLDGCDIYQRMKNRTEILTEKLKLSKMLEKPQTYLIVDFIIKLPLIVKKDIILIVCNRLSKIMYFVATTEETLVERLARLFRDNIWKLHRLLQNVISDRRLQFTVKQLKKILEIEMKLLTLFYLQIDSQTKQINYELEQYLWFFINYRQKNWPEQLATAEFIINSITRMFLFIANYSRELRMDIDIRKKEKVTEFTEKMKKVLKKTRVILRKI